VRSRLVTLLALGAAALLALPALAPAATKPKPVVFGYTVTNGKVLRGNKKPSVKKGRLVRFVVVANKGEEVHLHGYDIERTVKPGKQTVIQFTAKVAGRFELEMHHPDILIARLTVTP
jgi:hypothetical protein